MAIGRVGCLLTEQPGTPTGGGWGITLDDGRGRAHGVARPASRCTRRSSTRSPSTWWRSRCCGGGCGAAACRRGRRFVWYVAAYGVFRFLVEFVRGNDVAWEGLTRPQLFLLATVPLVARADRLAGQAGRLS